MHNAVSALPDALKKKVVAGVLFGDTRNKQDGGQVPKYPKDQVKIFCDPEDGVCFGKLSVTKGHMSYMEPGRTDDKQAVAFLKSKIDPALGQGKRFVLIRKI
jgi:cutinase